jgi:glutamine amidotransferase
VFAHNGNIEGFGEVRDELLGRIPPVLRRFILGTTDSEVLFYLILGKMAQRCELHRPGFPSPTSPSRCARWSPRSPRSSGRCARTTTARPILTYLTFVLTNGHAMLAHQGGKQLYVSTHKRRCPERDTCPHFAPECERAAEHGFISHLVLSSEPLDGDNVWEELRPTR